MHKALFVGIEAGPTHQEDAAEFLRGALEPVEHEQDTRHWYALRFGPADFAIFDTFPGNAGRLKHLFGTVGRALVVKTFTILNGLPEIEPADILALKVPAADALPRFHRLGRNVVAFSGYNGRGIAPDSGGEGHHGLSIMRERARQLDGSLAIQPGASGGTCVEMRFRPRAAPTESNLRGTLP